MSAPHPAKLPTPHDGERSCFTCGNSPPFPGDAGCNALTMNERKDMPVIDYCERSGANDADGWPTDRTIACPLWIPR